MIAPLFKPALFAAVLVMMPMPLLAGSLTIYASGEDLATEGFNAPKLTRDGWSLEFTRILATFDRITAWQTDPPFMADGPEISGRSVTIPGPFTVDLVAADNDHRVRLAAVDAPSGHFNALSWALVPAAPGGGGDAAGFSLMFEGLARKDGKEVPFTLQTADGVMHACTEYVGDERKGFVTAGGAADLEITLHLDHLFGRADKEGDGEMNTQSLGFERFSTGGTHVFSLGRLHVGHVGEGHCHVTML